ncbi:MAG: hypothetical protein ACLRSD_04795 [Oscillibacter sp.]
MRALTGIDLSLADYRITLTLTQAAECERCEHHGGRARAAVPRDASAALGGYAAFLA